jgi:hypothetical protein
MRAKNLYKKSFELFSHTWRQRSWVFNAPVQHNTQLNCPEMYVLCMYKCTYKDNPKI